MPHVKPGRGWRDSNSQRKSTCRFQDGFASCCTTNATIQINEGSKQIRPVTLPKYHPRRIPLKHRNVKPSATLEYLMTVIMVKYIAYTFIICASPRWSVRENIAILFSLCMPTFVSEEISDGILGARDISSSYC
ncbi:hypothetical protein PoB_002969900 [Plakobranchus ocellatus]|uniref:Uncharacterized protein n=1 Tax=Plakobranchus ocellatus TaxID=259542 RepID=A0AAV4AAD4_9GAST|nr:hypothetical protein PoB_002969900 [Plakobranchus ocellatus]